MNKKSTLPILYHGGFYGTYLEWCLTMLTTDAPLVAPFTDKGNSHNFRSGHFLEGIDGWSSYVDSLNQWDFVRLHPKVNITDNVQQNLDKISSQVNYFVYIYPTDKSFLLVLNNHFTKVWEDWWNHAFLGNQIDKDVIYNNWPSMQNIAIEETPQWIKREFLSYYMMPMWIDQIAWNHPNHYNQSNCLLVRIEDILYNIKNTVSDIISRSKVIQTKSVEVLEPYHDQMLGIQVNLEQDTLCRKILDSITNQTTFDWQNQNLPLASEAYIQWELRNRRLEMRCDGLDKFPTSSVQLKELLYPV